MAVIYEALSPNIFGVFFDFEKDKRMDPRSDILYITDFNDKSFFWAGEIARENSILFLNYSKVPYLPQIIEEAKKNGFHYVEDIYIILTTVTDKKPESVLGRYSRTISEGIALFARGDVLRDAKMQRRPPVSQRIVREPLSKKLEKFLDAMIPHHNLLNKVMISRKSESMSGWSQMKI
jgi:hypothetical protein